MIKIYSLDIKARFDDVVGSLNIERLLDFRVWSYDEVGNDEERNYWSQDCIYEGPSASYNIILEFAYQLDPSCLCGS